MRIKWNEMKQTAKWSISTTRKKNRKNQLKCFVYHLYNFVQFSHTHTQSDSPLSLFHRFPFDSHFFRVVFAHFWEFAAAKCRQSTLHSSINYFERMKMHAKDRFSLQYIFWLIWMLNLFYILLIFVNVCMMSECVCVNGMDRNVYAYMYRGENVSSHINGWFVII